MSIELKKKYTVGPLKVPKYFIAQLLLLRVIFRACQRRLPCETFLTVTALKRLLP